LRYRDLGNEQCNRFRRTNIGFVFQELRLINHLTATENVMLPRLFEGHIKSELMNTAVGLLGQVDLGERVDHFPYELSYGEQQRVAIARAVVTKPKIVLADEPTANLDNKNTERVISILHSLRASGTTFVVATHDDRLSRAADRVVEIAGGVLQHSG